MQGLALPDGRGAISAAGGEGVWVLGLIRGSAADAVGLQQGDQLLELDGRQLQRQSPFQVASLLQGQEEEQQQPAPGLGLGSTAVQLKARHCRLYACMPTLLHACAWQKSPAQHGLLSAAAQTASCVACPAGAEV